MINAAEETRRADETKIMQKVNAVNREAFVQRLPGHIEHAMRLSMERLGVLLSKPPGVLLEDPHTWIGSTQEIVDLTQALLNLESLRANWPMPARV
jgi:hypothetical protein